MNLRQRQDSVYGFGGEARGKGAKYFRYQRRVRRSCELTFSAGVWSIFCWTIVSSKDEGFGRGQGEHMPAKFLYEWGDGALVIPYRLSREGRMYDRSCEQLA